MAYHFIEYWYRIEIPVLQGKYDNITNLFYDTWIVSAYDV